jgi:chromate transporter
MKNNNQNTGRLCLSLFWEFFKIGLFTIGGGMAMLPLIHKLVVDDKKWLDEEEAVDCIAISQALPGIIAINSGTYIGKRLCGLPGAIAATIGVIMPSFIIIIAVVSLLGAVSGNAAVEGAFIGIKAAVCGLIIVSAVRLGKKILKDPLTWVLAVMAFIMIAVFDITAIWAIIAGAAAGVVGQLIKSGKEADS